MPRPLVTIVITCYNYGNFLTQAIDSILSQTYGHIEIIVVDDGSTDSTSEVAQRYGHKIKYLPQANQGVVAARNNGAALAKGDYLCFVDADDYLDRQYIEVLLQKLLSADDRTMWAYADLEFVYEDRHTQHILPDFHFHRLLWENWIPVTALIRRVAFDQVEGFNSKLNTDASFEDWDLWLRFLEQGYKAVHVSGSVLYYRQHGYGRNVGGEAQRRKLVKAMMQDHPLLYRRLKVRLSMLIFTIIAKLHWYKKKMMLLGGHSE